MRMQEDATVWRELLNTVGPGILVLLILAFIVAMGVVLTILVLFREPIKDVLRRLVKAGGAEFATPAQPIGEQKEARKHRGHPVSSGSCGGPLH
jgi:hypothetical protein